MKDYFKLDMGGYPQQVSITGDERKPILLLLHGGPGTPCMSFFRQMNAPLLEDFLMVTWDQRGTGRSYSKKLDLSTITLNQIVQDTHLLTRYLLQRFKKDKLYILGHSFGATVALQVITEAPENYHAYFGVSQFVNTCKNEQHCYEGVMDLAKKANNHRAVKRLQAIGKPVQGFYSGNMMKNLMYVKQLVTKYKGDTRKGNSSAQVLFQLLFSKEYGFHRFPTTIKGLQLSLKIAGQSLKGIAYDQSHRSFAIPVYFFSGDYDLLTPSNILRDYYETITAPSKKLFKFHHSAHSPLWEESEKFHAIIHEISTKDTLLSATSSSNG